MDLQRPALLLQGVATKQQNDTLVTVSDNGATVLSTRASNVAK